MTPSHQTPPSGLSEWGSSADSELARQVAALREQVADDRRTHRDFIQQMKPSHSKTEAELGRLRLVEAASEAKIEKAKSIATYLEKEHAITEKTLASLYDELDRQKLAGMVWEGKLEETKKSETSLEKECAALKTTLADQNDELGRLRSANAKLENATKLATALEQERATMKKTMADQTDELKRLRLADTVREAKLTKMKRIVTSLEKERLTLTQRLDDQNQNWEQKTRALERELAEERAQTSADISRFISKRDALVYQTGSLDHDTAVGVGTNLFIRNAGANAFGESPVQNVRASPPRQSRLAFEGITRPRPSNLLQSFPNLDHFPSRPSHRKLEATDLTKFGRWAPEPSNTSRNTIIADESFFPYSMGRRPMHLNDSIISGPSASTPQQLDLLSNIHNITIPDDGRKHSDDSRFEDAKSTIDEEQDAGASQVKESTEPLVSATQPTATAQPEEPKKVVAMTRYVKVNLESETEGQPTKHQSHEKADQAAKETLAKVSDKPETSKATVNISEHRKSQQVKSETKTVPSPPVPTTASKGKQLALSSDSDSEEDDIFKLPKGGVRKPLGIIRRKPAPLPTIAPPPSYKAGAADQSVKAPSMPNTTPLDSQRSSKIQPGKSFSDAAKTQLPRSASPKTLAPKPPVRKVPKTIGKSENTKEETVEEGWTASARKPTFETGSHDRKEVGIGSGSRLANKPSPKDTPRPSYCTHSRESDWKRLMRDYETAMAVARGEFPFISEGEDSSE